MSEDSPFDELDSDAEKRGESIDEGTDPSDLIEKKDAGPVDPEAPWDEITLPEDEDEEDDLLSEVAEENPTQEMEPEIDAEGEEAVIPKNRYCQRCKHFSAPPEVSCGHPGTEIEEMVDAERFQVRNCPIVRERHGSAEILDMD
jgi:hypothetical protein